MRRAGPGVRGACALALAAPVLLPLLAAAARLVGPDPVPRLVCRVLPNGRVPILAGSGAGCPLAAHDAVRTRPLALARGAGAAPATEVELAVASPAGLRWRAVPLRRVARDAAVLEAGCGAVVAAALLAIPALLLRRSRAPAVPPFALFYAAVALLVALRVADLRGAWSARAELVALLLAPAALAHLALVFPARRRVAREAPGVTALPYAAALVLVPVGLRALERDGLLWPALSSFALAATAGLWALVVAACALALRESRIPLERARARAVLLGAAILPALLAPLVAGETRSHAELGARALLASVAVGPVPVGLAASRYNLFDLGSDARRLAARLVVYATVAGAACGLAALVQAALGRHGAWPAPTSLFAVALLFAAGVDAARRLLLGRLEAAIAPSERLRQRVLARTARRVAELRSPEEAAALLAAGVRRALGSAGVAVFLAGPRGWRPARLEGRTPFRPADAARAARRLGRRRIAQLTAEEAAEGDALPGAASLEAVAALRAGGERQGLVLVAPRPDGCPLTSADLGLLAGVCAQAAVALRNARLAEDLVAAERQAVVGRLSLALAHDLGKELDWVRRLARRLPERLREPERAARDAATIAELADGVAGSLRGFVREAARDACTERGRERAPLAALVDRAVREASRLHRGARVSVGLDPAVRGLLLERDLVAVLRNLLDNALHASPDGAAVHVSATRESGRLRLEVVDRGRGLDAEARARAFEPGFSTRADRGGAGAGLPVARAVAAALGGRVTLERRPQGGARARVVLPLPEGGSE